MMKRWFDLLIVVFLLGVLAGCGGLLTAASTDSEVDASVTAPATAVVVEALPTTKPVVPTSTPEPTSTPLPEPTATTAPAGSSPPRVKNNAPGGTAAKYAEGEVIVRDSFLFRIHVIDTRFGDKDGDGIEHVEFFVSTLDGNAIYSRRENHAGYCIFGGGEPNCNTWPQHDGRYVWGEGGPEVQPGNYHVSILVTPKDQDFEGEVWNWDFDFTVELP